VHELTILNLHRWLDLPSGLFAVVAFVAAALGAAALHHGVEQPAQRRLSRLGPRRASDGPV
jgi:peptidoglycan/LPS O-acetylase OafA/YrhL